MSNLISNSLLERLRRMLAWFESANPQSNASAAAALADHRVNSRRPRRQPGRPRMLYHVHASAAIGGKSNQWEYTLRRVMPSGTDGEVDELTDAEAPAFEITAFNRFEINNTASVIGHGQDLTIAGVGSFTIDEIPDGTGPFPVDGPYPDPTDPDNVIWYFYAVNPQTPACE